MYSLRRKITAVVATIGLWGLFPLIANAQTFAFNNFDAGQSFDAYNGSLENSANNLIDSYQSGSAFVSAASGQLTGIDAALTSAQDIFGGDNVGGNIDLWSNSGSDTPGVLLGDWSFGSLDAFGYTSNDPVHFAASGVNLVAGDQYWLTIDPTNSTNGQSIVWDNNIEGSSGTLWQGQAADGPSSFYTTSGALGAFDVTVNAVPEASTTVTFVLTLVAGGFLLARKRTLSSVA
jgi:hypothetical protein